MERIRRKSCLPFSPSRDASDETTLPLRWTAEQPTDSGERNTLNGQLHWTSVFNNGHSTQCPERRDTESTQYSKWQVYIFLVFPLAPARRSQPQHLVIKFQLGCAPHRQVGRSPLDCPLKSSHTPHQAALTRESVCGIGGLQKIKERPRRPPTHSLHTHSPGRSRSRSNGAALGNQIGNVTIRRARECAWPLSSGVCAKKPPPSNHENRPTQREKINYLFFFCLF